MQQERWQVYSSEQMVYKNINEVMRDQRRMQFWVKNKSGLNRKDSLIGISLMEKEVEECSR